jgi:hypothetical protein
MKVSLFTVANHLQGRQAKKGRTSYPREKAFLDPYICRMMPRVPCPGVIPSDARMHAPSNTLAMAHDIKFVALLQECFAFQNIPCLYMPLASHVAGLW